MNVKLFKIECLTNMHVGNGDVNFNIIDNEVERDCVMGYPTINASGVKGALREFFEATVGKGELVDDIFGPEKSDSGVPGKIKFLCANMLAIPMRASDGAVYHMVTTKKAVDTYNALAQSLLDEKAKTLGIETNAGKAEVEGVVCDMTDGLAALGLEKVAVMSDEDFGEPTLPVVARNKLENGKSKNLWFEEVVPHKSVFYFFAIANGNETDRAVMDKLVEKINGKVVQFGGNATIGYGLCKVEAL